MEIYQRLKPLLFKFDAEKMHHFSQKSLRALRALPFGDDMLLRLGGYSDESLAQEILGLRFYNPIGLAAGFDKDAQYVKPLAGLGFGYLELGTITKIPQSGNPKPRLFRHESEESLQNAMGFNNLGSVAFATRLKKLYPFCIPLGINIGKNKEINEEDAALNYQKTLEDVLDIGDYYTFNLSSPNTPNLRDLQNEKFVESLFTMARQKTQKPLFLKIAPDMDIDSALSVCAKALDSGASGIIATNTTTDTSLIANSKHGGISGAALCEKSREMFAALAKTLHKTHKSAILISVGGVANAKEAYSRIRLGASLVQVYTGLIYQGPSLCAKMSQELTALLKADGFDSIAQAVGADL